MGFAFQVIEVAAWMFGYFTVPLRSILRTMIFCPFRLSPWSPWLIKFRDPTAACTGTDDDALLKVDTPVLIIPFDLCIWWRWSSWYYLWIIPWSELWSFFFGHFFSVPFFSTELLFVSSYLTSLAFLALYTWLLYSFHHFPAIFFIYFWFIFLGEF